MLYVLFLKYCATRQLLFIDYWYKSYCNTFFDFITLLNITSFSYLFSLSFVEFYWFEVYDRYWQNTYLCRGTYLFFQIVIIVPSSLKAERNGTTPRPEDKILRDEEGIRWEKGRMTGQKSGFVRFFCHIPSPSTLPRDVNAPHYISHLKLFGARRALMPKRGYW